MRRNTQRALLLADEGYVNTPQEMRYNINTESVLPKSVLISIFYHCEPLIF